MIFAAGRHRRPVFLAGGWRKFCRASRITGRVEARRNHGGLIFIDIVDGSGKLQLLCARDSAAGTNLKLAQLLDRGDWIGAEGPIIWTNTGELSLSVEKLTALAKSLEPFPSRRTGLTDPDRRQRERYVDLTSNESSRRRFRPEPTYSPHCARPF